MCSSKCTRVFFFFNDTATTEIYTLSLHDALPICTEISGMTMKKPPHMKNVSARITISPRRCAASLKECCVCIFRSEEHTSELQSRQYLVCRLLLEKKK